MPPEPEGRAASCAGLSLPELVHRLRDPTSRAAAERALLGERQDEMLETLPALLRDPDFSVRAQARRILGRFADALREDVMDMSFTPADEREPGSKLVNDCSRIALARIEAACRDSAQKRPPPSPGKNAAGERAEKRARRAEKCEENGDAVDLEWCKMHRAAEDLGTAGLLRTQEPKQLQLLVACEWVDFLSGEKKGEREDYFTADWEPQAYRTIVVGANCTLFHLLKTIQTAFGLDDTSKDFEPGNAIGSLGLDGMGAIISEPGDDNGLTEPIAGIDYRDEELCEVATSTLKQVKVGDVVTQCTMTTVHRDRTLSLCAGEGGKKGRSTFSLQMHLKQSKAWYAFAILCHASATDNDMASSCQSLLPRCVEGQGSVIGGNLINYAPPALTLADVDAKAAADAKAREAKAAADAASKAVSTPLHSFTNDGYYIENDGYYIENDGF